MDYNKLFQKLKNKHYPELEHYHIEFKEKNQKAFMDSHNFSIRDILNRHKLHPVTYNKETIKKSPKKATEGAIIHELAHKIQALRSNFFQSLYMGLAYRLSNKYKIKIEQEANEISIKKGFKKELLELKKYCKSRFPKEKWAKMKKFHI
ncbi:hypothetical protein CL616_02525 [archaeon]|nr:hypothetical protein [archaeon]|tara:strand:- start:696 stop:1142 length:447 start_codon:yes stop_codon:yes gene_type:complete